MTPTKPIWFPSRELAEAIAAIHGQKPVSITVKMLGKDDVARYIRIVQSARATPPSGIFRCRNAAAIG